MAKKIIVCLTAAGLLLGILTGIVLGVMRFRQNQHHYTVTVWLKGAMDNAASSGFAQTSRCSAGDDISFAEVVLRVTKVSGDGTLKFTVEQGSLYNAEKETVKNGTLSCDVNADYRFDGGSVSLKTSDPKDLKKE